MSEPLQDCLDSQRSALDEFIQIVDSLIAVVINHEAGTKLRDEDGQLPDACTHVLPLLMQALGSSSHTLLRLSETPGLQTRDCYSIARSIVELAANICYIMANGPEAAERAIRHSRQKAFRDLNRESKIGRSVINLKFNTPIDPSSVEGLASDIDEFTSKKGREKGWIDKSIDTRIEASRSLGPGVVTSLHWARFSIYRHSSEILHGTFFGAAFFFGMTTPSGKRMTRDECAEGVGQQQMLILMSTSLALSAVIEGFHAAYGFRKADDGRKRLWKTLR